MEKAGLYIHIPFVQTNVPTVIFILLNMKKSLLKATQSK